MEHALRIELYLGDITLLETEAIVNAANPSLLGGGGVDGAIHKAAGPELLRETQLLGGCRTGDAKITSGYNLPAKFVIHTVGPVWNEGRSKEYELLKSCYSRSLELARENNISSLAFPSISTGIYGFPYMPAAEIAVNTVVEYIEEYAIPEKIVFVCFSEEVFSIYQGLLHTRGFTQV